MAIFAHHWNTILSKTKSIGKFQTDKNANIPSLILNLFVILGLVHFPRFDIFVTSEQCFRPQTNFAFSVPTISHVHHVQNFQKYLGCMDCSFINYYFQ